MNDELLLFGCLVSTGLIFLCTMVTGFLFRGMLRLEFPSLAERELAPSGLNDPRDLFFMLSRKVKNMVEGNSELARMRRRFIRLLILLAIWPGFAFGVFFFVSFVLAEKSY